MKNVNRIKMLCGVISLLCNAAINATSLQCPKEQPCFCPDMSEYSGTIPEGWHVRFNENIKSDSSNTLQVIILEKIDKKDKNNFYCRYTNRDGATFVLSTSIPVKTITQSNKVFWKYDTKDDLWECHPTARTGKTNITQCAFTLN